MIRLLTLADGFGDSVAVPAWYPNYIKWPEIIKLMTRDINVVNLSRYGAGNEYMINQLRGHADSADVVLIQWAQPNRLDLVLSHSQSNSWKDVIASDTVYNNNIVSCGTDQFWLSSASTVEPVKIYHSQYISMRQHQLRSQIYIDYAKLLLESQNKTYGFMLVNDAEYLNVDANWIWHDVWKGMESFKKQSQYQELDLGIVQPLPLIAFDFVKKFVVPFVDLNWRNDQDIKAVENMLYRHYQEAVKNRPL